MDALNSPLFNRALSRDPGSLTGALLLHCRSVEDVLLEGGQVPGVDYVALDIVRVAATLMTAPITGEDGFARWRLPEPGREDSRSSQDEDDLPF